MRESVEIALLLAGFGASHVALSSVRWRPRLVARLGEPGFLGLYSLVAFAFFVPATWLYFGHRHAGPALWSPGLEGVARAALYAGMGVAFVLIAASFVNPSPAALGRSASEPRGVHFLTRHPQNMGIALFALLHLVPNGFASDVAFFGGLALFAIAGSWHQDRRKLVQGPPGYRDFVAATPFFPFTGTETLRGLRELSPLAIGLGAGVTVLLRSFHAQLFGP